MKFALLRALPITSVDRAVANIPPFSVEGSGHKVMICGVVCGAGYC